MKQLSMLAALPGENPKMPGEPIVREAWVEGPYRFTLKRVWGAGPLILWCGLNPSTADSVVDDPTMRREIGFSYRWGFGGLVKVNIYPFRSADPKEMLAWRKTWDTNAYYNSGCPPWEFERGKTPFGAFQHNIATIQKEIKEDTVCVAAWGNHADPKDLEYFLENVRRVVNTDEHDGFGDVGVLVGWKCLGTNADGSPRHTLARGKNRIADDATLVPWKEAA